MPDLPSGTITFLFTDIEGSTRLWESQRGPMQAALSRHDELMRECIEARGGYVFKTVGDAFCAAFPTAPDALEAAISAQRALDAELWNDECVIRVRMALHTGAAEERGGDYFGPPLNRVARLLSAGHGRQVLLSLPTQELVRDYLPASMGLRDMGEHRLKDLIRPERVFQAVAPGLPADFPPLKTLENRPNNLPLQPTPFIGRERELGELTALLRRSDARLITLTGAGGTGKTRLALQAAADSIEGFEDGVYFIDLAPITDPGLAPSTIAHALGVTESSGRSILDNLREYLRDKQLLLLVDNFEQVCEAAPVIAQLLSAAPFLKVLVTSRIPLRVRGERVFAVPSLSLPDPRRLPKIDALSQYDAVRLFIERARDARAGFEVTNENAPSVAEICVRLDGLPLAIELAAARVRLLPPQAMLSRLSSRLKLLTGGARDLPARQQTLRGTIDWSYSLLSEGEQQLFARLAVFAGGRTLEAVEAVCNSEGDLDMDVLDGIEALVDNSLLRQEEGPGGEPRFVVLETIHEYAREKLEESRVAEKMRRRHAEYFLTLGERSEAELYGSRQAEWLERLEEEHDNLRTGLAWALSAGGDTELGLRLAGTLWRFWHVRGYPTEGSMWLDRALGSCTQLTRARAKALNGAGVMAQMRGDIELALERQEESLALSRELGYAPGVAAVLSNLGNIAAALQDNYDRATVLYEEALALYRKLGDKHGMTLVLCNLGHVALARGEYDLATRLSQEALDLFRDEGDARGVSLVLTNLGNAALARGEYGEAAPLHRESLALSRELGDREGLAYCLEGIAAVAGGLCEARRAARLYGAAQALREAIDAPLHPPDRPIHERCLTTARAQMNQEAWAVAWAEGREMSLEEAIKYALENGSGG